MYTKYGKTCRDKKTSKSSTESEKSGKSNDSDPEVKKDEKNPDSSKTEDGVEDIGADNEEENADEEEEEEQENSPRHRRASVHFVKDQKPSTDDGDENDDDDNAMSNKEDNENPEDEEGEPESTDNDNNDVEKIDDEASSEGDAAESDENDQYDESEAYAEEASTVDDIASSKKKSKKVKPVMEYDVENMYPDIEILIQKKKREWDYQDPDIIRALWLQAKTQVLTEWKFRNAKIKIGKPSFEVRDTATVKLRQKHLLDEADRKERLENREFEMAMRGRTLPQLGKLEINTNLTFDMRYKYNRNNPPVPSHYIEHFEKFKRPPFDNNATRYVF